MSIGRQNDLTSCKRTISETEPQHWNTLLSLQVELNLRLIAVESTSTQLVLSHNDILILLQVAGQMISAAVMASSIT